MRGGSCIVAPTGEFVVAPSYDGPRLLHAEIDLDEIPRGKHDLDVCGHYARPDVFQLTVDERPKASVRFSS